MPQGEDYVTLTAVDALGYRSDQPANAEGVPSVGGQVTVSKSKIKVDHTAPKLMLSGTATEQEKLGTAQPEYLLKYNASDGIDGPAEALTPFGTAGSGNGQLKGPRALAADGKGHVYVVDHDNNRIEVFSESGAYLSQFGAKGSGNGQLLEPFGITINPEGKLWVADTGNGRIEEFSASGEYLAQFGAKGATSSGTTFVEPLRVAAAPGGMLWVADGTGNRVAEFRESLAGGERFVRNATGPGGSGKPEFAQPIGIAVDPSGIFYVVDHNNHRVQKFDASGKYLAQFGSLGSAGGQLNNPSDIALAPSGDVLVTDQENNRVEQFGLGGDFVRQFGTAGTGNANLSEPRGIAFGAGNVVFVADKGHNRIAKWTNADSDPQSGVVKGEIKVDGKKVDETAPGCGTKDCAIAREWALKASQFSGGKHTVEVVVTDGVGLSATKTLAVEAHPDKTAPAVALSGTMTEQATLGASRPRYILKLNATDPVGSDGSMAFTSAFGSAGTGNGQFNHPADAAVDSKGNVFVVDEFNNRIEKFNEKGEYISKFGSAGSGNGQFNRPTAIAIAASGKIWVTDAGNCRIQQFSESGEYLTKVGSCGAGNGQFGAVGPEGIAIGPAGGLWVSDTYNGRLEKFSETGEFVKIVASKGTGTGQLGEPTAIDLGPNGNAWVADRSNNRLSEFTQTGEFIRQVGATGTGDGQFKNPGAIEVDSANYVWAGDEKNSRVQELSPSGEYLYQFGSAGTGAGQFSFSAPFGVTADAKGNLLIADATNNRIQKWTPPQGSNSGVAATTIEVDGKAVDSTSPGCPAGACSISREWILSSDSYSAGAHTVEAIATDGAGLSSSKTLAINVARDTTAPELTPSSAKLFTAPEGWLEQKEYFYSATASDPEGYGITSIQLKIDGKAVKTTSQKCLDGGCGLSMPQSGVNIANYKGGAHPAELIATDGAGNVAKKAWTINVDPKGQITVSEAEDTLEALDETSSVNTLGPAKQEDDIEGTQAGLTLQPAGENLEATGSVAPTTIEGGPGGSVTVEIPGSTEATPVCSTGGTTEGPGAKEKAEAMPQVPECQPSYASEAEHRLVPIEVTPKTVAGGAAPTTLSDEDSAAISTNVLAQVDVVTRPLYDGAMTFADIRDATGSETFAWTVHLDEDQELKLIDSKHATVYYADGVAAFSITAAAAHDAIGSTVPTSLSVENGDVITLTVAHHGTSPAGGSFVYPIAAGVGWEGGFQEYRIAMPPNEGEEPGAIEEERITPGTANFLTFGPPELLFAARTGVRERSRAYRFNSCRKHIMGVPIEGGPGKTPELPRQEAVEKGESVQCHNPPGPEVGDLLINWATVIYGRFYYRWGKKIWIEDAPHCNEWGPYVAERKHCYVRGQGSWESTTRISLAGDWRFAGGKFEGGNWSSGQEACFELVGVLPTEPARSENGESVYFENFKEWNQPIGFGGNSCPWEHLLHNPH